MTRSELQDQKESLDKAYAERMKLMETMLERQAQSKMDELSRKCKQEKDEMAASHAHQVAEMQEQMHARQVELRERADAASRELDETRRNAEQTFEKLGRQLKEAEVELIFAQENLKSTQFDLGQLRLSQDEAVRRCQAEHECERDELRRTIADLEAKLAANKMAAEQSGFQRALRLDDDEDDEEKNATAKNNDGMEWEDSVVNQSKKIEQVDVGVQVSFLAEDKSIQTNQVATRSFGVDVTLSTTDSYSKF